MDDDQRSEDSVGDAGDFGNVCGEDAAASERRDARGRRARGEQERADVAQLVEHSLGKGEVTSSILVIGSRYTALRGGGSNSVVESQPSKLLVAGSIPVSRSRVF